MMDKLEFYVHFFGYAKDSRLGKENEEFATDYLGNKYPKFDFYDYKGKAKLVS